MHAPRTQEGNLRVLIRTLDLGLAVLAANACKCKGMTPYY